jgi:hypothetical protein
VQILGGILTFESEWNPPIGEALNVALSKDNGCLNLGCIAAHGYFKYNQDTNLYDFIRGSKPATAFLFMLISQLQFSGTVPMIDIIAYSKWLT